MARVPVNILPLEVLPTVGAVQVKAPDPSTPVSVYTDSAHTTLATVYAAETGGSTLTQPLTPTATGAVPGWVNADFTRLYWQAGVLAGFFIAHDANPLAGNRSPTAAITTTPTILSGNEITDAIRAAGVWGDGIAAPDQSLAIWGPITPRTTIPGATDLGLVDGNAQFDATVGVVAAPTFFVGNYVAPTRDTTQHKFGGTAYKCVTPGSGSREGFSLGSWSVTTGQYVSTGIWIWGPSGTITVGIDAGVSTFQNVTLDGTYHYVPLSLLPTTPTSSFRIQMATVGTHAVTFWVGGAITLTPNEPVSLPYSGGVARAGGRVQIPATILSATHGAVILRGSQGFAPTQPGAVNPVWWEWRQDATHYLQLRYNTTLGRWEFEAKNGASSSTAVLTDAPARDADRTLMLDFSGTTMRLAVANVNGNAWVTQTGVSLPALTTATCDLGSAAGAANWLNGRLRWAAVYSTALGTTDPATIAGWTNTAPTWAQMSGLSVGESVTLARWSAASPGYLAIQPVTDGGASTLQLGALGVGTQPRAGVAATLAPPTVDGSALNLRANPSQTGPLLTAEVGGSLQTIIDATGAITAPVYAAGGPEVSLNKKFWKTGDPDWTNALARFATWTHDHAGFVLIAEQGDYPYVGIIAGSAAVPYWTPSATLSLRGLRGVALWLQGVRFIDTQVYSGHNAEFGDYSIFAQFQDCIGITAEFELISQLDGVETFAGGSSTVCGAAAVSLVGSCQDYAVRLRQTGGYFTFGAVPTQTATRGTDLSQSGTVCALSTDVHYPGIFIGSGFDTVFRTNATRCGRNLHVQGTKHLRAAVFSTNQKVETLLEARNNQDLEDVDLYYYDHSPSSVSYHQVAAQIYVVHQCAIGPGAGHAIRDVRIHLDVDTTNTNYGDVLAIAKIDEASTQVTTGNGSTLDGLTITGRATTTGAYRAIAMGQTGAVANHYGQYTASSGTPDVVRGVRIHDFAARGGSASILLDFGGAAAVEPVRLDNVTADGTVTLLNGATGLFQANDVTASGWTTANAVQGGEKVAGRNIGASLATRFNLEQNGTSEHVGSGSPNSAVTANPGSVYRNTAGGAGTALWTKESGSNTNSGWVGK